ncbi:MAG: hypothetical protein WAN17_04570, partial [Candidatus Sulfotelmatobacter sp.]
LAAEQNVILNRADSVLDEFGGRGEFHAARSAAVEFAALSRNYSRTGQWSVAGGQKDQGNVHAEDVARGFRPLITDH